MIEIEKHPDRRGYRLTAEQLLPAPIHDVFAFFSDAFQLEKITPPWLNFHVTTQPPIKLGEGTLLDYRLRLRGIPLRWRSKISEWVPPYRFVDEQLRGPYRFWHHLHTFQDQDGQTLVRDEVSYGVLGGAIVHRLLVKPDLLRIFQFRQDALRDRFPSD